MILAFDIGNTNITVCVMKNRDVLQQFRLRTDQQKTTDEYAMIIMELMRHHQIDIQAFKAAVISSVVPPLTFIFRRLADKYLGIDPIVVDNSSDHGLNILLDNPSEMGADRLMAVLAAHTLYGGDCIVVDFGTAITLEVISAAGEYCGGIIFPGIGLASRALHSATAKLPEVGFARPERVVGSNTVKSIQSGLFYGYVELMDGLIDRIKEERFPNGSPTLISTGGLGRGISSASRHELRYEANLVPYGLYVMYERMR